LSPTGEVIKNFLDMPQGAAYGDYLPLPPGYPDAGTVAGLTDPEGTFYDPPREGVPEAYLANTGNTPQNYP
jgi:hypothetical protein